MSNAGVEKLSPSKEFVPGLTVSAILANGGPKKFVGEKSAGNEPPLLKIAKMCKNTDPSGKLSSYFKTFKEKPKPACGRSDTCVSSTPIDQAIRELNSLIKIAWGNQNERGPTGNLTYGRRKRSNNLPVSDRIHEFVENRLDDIASVYRLFEAFFETRLNAACSSILSGVCLTLISALSILAVQACFNALTTPLFPRLPAFMSLMLLDGVELTPLTLSTSELGSPCSY